MNFFTSIASCASTIYLFSFVIVFLILYRLLFRSKNLPSGPIGIPLLGSLPFLGKYPERTLKKWSKTYGPIMTVQFGTMKMVVLNDFESINQAFTKQASIFSGRPYLPYLELVSRDLGLILVDYGENWKIQRKFGLMTLRGFGMGKQSLEEKIIEETSYLMDEIRKKNGEAFSTAALIHNAVSNVICSVCFGKRFEYDDPTFQSLIHAILAIFTEPGLSGAMQAFMFAPFLAKIPPLTHYHKRTLEINGQVLTILRDIIDEHESSFDKDNLRDFIDAYLLEMKNESHSSFTYEQLSQFIRDLFEAGTETTSSTLAWTFLVLLHYPQAQKKLREEIHQVIGSSGVVTWSKRSDMPYTSALMEELFRFRTLVPLAIQHATSQDAKLGNYIIPKGTMVLSNLWAVHNDETIWNKPEIFNPERFLNDKGEFVKSQYVIPFSVGPRHCLGEQLARTEFFIFLVSLIQQFEFLPDPDSKDLPNIESGSPGFSFVPLQQKIIVKEL